jgi:chromosome segregation ATPase
MSRNVNSEFLAKFDDSLRRLSKLNDMISKNTTNKKEFSAFVLSKLQELNVKIKEIVEKIKQIKSQLVLLQGSVNQNTSGIQNKDKEIADLKANLEKLTQEKKNLEDLINNEIPKNTNKNLELQKEIDEKESKLRELESKNVALMNEKEALQKELSNRGDLQGQHAQEIQQLSEKNKLEVEKMQQENIKQIQELQKQIADKDTQIQSNLQKIQSLEQQIVEKDKKIAELESKSSSVQQQQQQNVEAIKSANDKIAQLENEKLALQQMNDDLIKRIVAATEVINNATIQLEELTNQNFYDKSNQDFIAIINEIEASLQQIINTIQGTGTVGQNVKNLLPPPPGSITNLPPSPPDSIQQKNRTIVYQNQTLKINDLLKGLKTKGEQVARTTGEQNNKYIKAYNLISNINPNISDMSLITTVTRALPNIDVDVNALGVLTVKGGNNMSLKKTKKHHKKMKSHYTRKQKGGFLWGKQKTSSIKTPKTSSYLVTSFSKKNRRSTGRGVTKHK